MALKAILSYSKKVPADEQYSSQSYHLSLEQELPASLRLDEIRAQMHETFELRVRSRSCLCAIYGRCTKPIFSATTELLNAPIKIVICE